MFSLYFHGILVVVFTDWDTCSTARLFATELATLPSTVLCKSTGSVRSKSLNSVRSLRRRGLVHQEKETCTVISIKHGPTLAILG